MNLLVVAWLELAAVGLSLGMFIWSLNAASHYWVYEQLEVILVKYNILRFLLLLYITLLAFQMMCR